MPQGNKNTNCTKKYGKSTVSIFFSLLLFLYFFLYVAKNNIYNNIILERFGLQLLIYSVQTFLLQYSKKW